MSTTLYAQPYDLAASGFYFESAEDYAAKAKALQNDHGQPVEEFEIQFIDGERIDAELAKATGLHQGDIVAFFEKTEGWSEHDKQTIIIAVGECGYAFDWGRSDPADFDVEIYAAQSLRELAEQFVEEGLFGDVPERLQFYLDYDAIARDLGMDYAETTIAGERLVCRCG